MNITDHPALMVLAVAAAAPLLAEIPIGVQVPVVVLEVLLGMLIGPHVLGWLEASSFLTLMQNAGTAALLFMAGMEIDFLAHELGLERILGAFSAGMVIGVATRGEEGEPVRAKLDAVMFGWLTPFFFVGTGMQFDPGALTRDFTTMLLIQTFLLLLLLVHWVPVFIYRGELTRPERLPFALSTSVASLGLTMVIVRIGVAAKHMTPDIAQALVATAMLSLLVFPTLAGVLLSRAAPPARSAGSG